MSQSRAIENRVSLASDAGGRMSPLGLIAAVLLHVIIIGATLFSFAHKLDITAEDSPVVPVDLVTLAQKTNLRAMVKEQPKAPPKEDVQPAPPAPQPVVTPPPPPQVKPDVPDQAPSEPTIAKAEPAPVPVAKPQDKPKPVAPPKPVKQTFDINNISALLNKQQPAAASARNARTGPRNVKAFGSADAMTADLQDTLRSQIAQCWSPPIGAPHAEDLIVDFDLFLNKDGSVAQTPQLTGESASAVSGNPYTRAAAEAARRAIYECAPYKLPVDRYDQWHEINPFHFDPRQMMGQ
jgi:outer membrane biosynthesis protein TonB